MYNNITSTLNILNVKEYKIKNYLCRLVFCYGIPQKYPTSENENYYKHPYSLLKIFVNK